MQANKTEEEKTLFPDAQKDQRGTALLPEERPEEYEALHARIMAAVVPTDAVEEVWVEDFAELSFEIKQLRRIKTRIVSGARAEAVEKLLEPPTDSCDARNMARAWSVGHDKEAIQILTMMKLSSEDIAAKAFELRLAEVDKINGMITQAEMRRNAALREVDRHREVLAARLRAAAAIEDAEFQEVAPAPAITGALDGWTMTPAKQVANGWQKS